MEWVIDPLLGIGNIKFGDTTKSVKKLLGSELYYEEWMGGNLEDFLCYEGLLIGFRGDHNLHPNDDSEMNIIILKASAHKIILWNEVISYFSQSQMIAFLTSRKISFRKLNEKNLQCTKIDMCFCFDSNLLLDEVAISSSKRT